MTRTAGVLAIAVVGSMAISVFETNLDQYASVSNLGEPLRHSLLAQAGKLGEAVIPADVPTESKATVGHVNKTCAGWDISNHHARLCRPGMDVGDHGGISY